MRCEAHPEEEAVGTCKSCGRGVCTVCKVVFNGIIHCKSCVEAGRISGAAPPAAATAAPPYQYQYPYYQYANVVYAAPPPHIPDPPKPTGSPSRSFFLSGAAGGLVGGIITLLTGAAMLWGLAIGARYATELWIAVSVAVVFVATQVLAATGLFGFYRNYGTQLGWVAALTLIVGSALFPLMLALAVPQGAGYYPGYPPYYQYGYIQFDKLWAYVGGVCIATGTIIEGAAFLTARRFLKDPRPASAVGILMMVGGGLFAAFIGLYIIGWLLAAIGRFIAVPVFLGAPVPDRGPTTGAPAPRPGPVRPAAAGSGPRAK